MQIEVFTESPFISGTDWGGFQNEAFEPWKENECNNLRFIYDPINIIRDENLEHGDDFRHDRYQNCGSVLVPKSTKAKIDSIFQEIYGKTVPLVPKGSAEIEIDFKLDWTYGDILDSVIRSRCEEKRFECIDTCFCKFEKNRIWAHALYQDILEKCADWNGQKKKDFVTDVQNYYPKLTTLLEDFEWMTPYGMNPKSDQIYQQKHPRPILTKEGEVVSQSQSSVPYVLEEDEALRFIFASLFGRVGHLNFENLEERHGNDALDEDLFKECNKGKCNYNIEEVVWESKSEVTGEPDVTSVNLSRPMDFIKAPSYRPQNRMVPRSRIVSYKCKCSDEHGESILINHSSSEKEERDIGRCRHKIKIKGKNYTCDARWKANSPTCSNPKCKGKVKDNRIETVIGQSFIKYFMKVLPNRAVGNRRESAQAAVAAKLMAARVTGKTLRGVLKDSKDRHSKGQLRNTLNSYGSVMAYWPDLEDVQTLIEPRREKAKVICRQCRRQYSGNVEKCKNCGGGTIALEGALLHIALSRLSSNDIEQEYGR